MGILPLCLTVAPQGLVLHNMSTLGTLLNLEQKAKTQEKY